MKNDDISFSYETLWKFIIRPPRDEYNEKMLGESKFQYRNIKYERKDYSIVSSQGYLLKCSFIEPMKENRPSIEMPVVLYLHGNSSSRIEGLQICGELLKRNINLFIVDFAGCGLSEGEYISLGYHESHDVGIIINFIEKIQGVGRIGIWGRSMGAATTMIYAHRDMRVKAICLDSPFADFFRLAKELILKQITLPGFLITGMLKIIGNTIYGKNGLDIEKLKPINVANKTFQPAIFIHAKNDQLIDIKHSIDLIDKYGGKEKRLKNLDIGGHNTKRSKEIINEIGEFFSKHLISNNFSFDKIVLKMISKNKDIHVNHKDNNNVKNIINNKDVSKNTQEKNNLDIKHKLSEDEDYPFNNKKMEIEYMKNKEEKDLNHLNRMSLLLKSIKEVDIRKSIGSSTILNSDFTDFSNLNDEKEKDKKLNDKINNIKANDIKNDIMNQNDKNLHKHNKYLRNIDNNEMIFDNDSINKDIHNVDDKKHNKNQGINEDKNNNFDIKKNFYDNFNLKVNYNKDNNDSSNNFNNNITDKANAHYIHNNNNNNKNNNKNNNNNNHNHNHNHNHNINNINDNKNLNHINKNNIMNKNIIGLINKQNNNNVGNHQIKNDNHNNFGNSSVINFNNLRQGIRINNKK